MVVAVTVGVLVSEGTAPVVAVGGIGVAVCGTGVRVGGIGEDVKVAVGGTGVKLGVKVKVGGRNGVQVGPAVLLGDDVNVGAEVFVAVMVWISGVPEGPFVTVCRIRGVTEAGRVAVNVAVMVGVGVAVTLSGVRVQASQPTQ